MKKRQIGVNGSIHQSIKFFIIFYLATNDNDIHIHRFTLIDMDIHFYKRKRQNNLNEIGGYSFIVSHLNKEKCGIPKDKRRLWNNVAYLTQENGVYIV